MNVGTQTTEKVEYPIGTKYMRTVGAILTVIDCHKTHNSKGELVRIRYVATRPYLGQTLTYSDECAVTIARGIERLKSITA